MKTRYYYSVRIIDSYPNELRFESDLNRIASEDWDIVQLIPMGEQMAVLVRRPVSNEED